MGKKPAAAEAEKEKKNGKKNNRPLLYRIPYTASPGAIGFTSSVNSHRRDELGSLGVNIAHTICNARSMCSKLHALSYLFWPLLEVASGRKKHAQPIKSDYEAHAEKERKKSRIHRHASGKDSYIHIRISCRAKETLRPRGARTRHHSHTPTTSCTYELLDGYHCG